MKNVFFSKRPVQESELSVLQSELRAAQGELSLAYRQFDLATDPELVESCVYQISAAKARCNYLIRAIKARCPDTAAMTRTEEAATWT
ncbi:MAG: DUF2508 family protein [Oscillibacter sp.]|uniref:DUF2508 family protein n=1 Tax=Oscillibacter sp. TaxID=1945593 RepID=UPI00289FA854|nr:DUF2508 family protein [Oscillibacter sp.]MEA4994692.1 DUF2508 family protein [Oscillibacter sp.]